MGERLHYLTASALPRATIIDYYLPSAASGEVKLEFLNSEGKVIRTYSSADPAPSPARMPSSAQQ